jgi:dTDP-4-dehydrorhamnose reductase
LTPVATDEFPRAARRPANSTLNCARAEHFLGEKLPSWESGLEEYIALRQSRA